MSNRFFCSTLAAVFLTGMTSLPSAAVPAVAFQVAKKEEKPPAALVTDVEILQENIADTWFYTLKGSLKNQSDATILTPLIYYEIYAEGTDQILEAGTAIIEPKVLTAGVVGIFEKELNTAGKVKITLVQWQQGDKSVKAHQQMQFFPAETRSSNTSNNSEDQPIQSDP